MFLKVTTVLKEIIKNNRYVGPVTKRVSALLWKQRNNFKIWRLYYKNRQFLTRNKELKNTEREKGVFILATGPSINKMNLKKLAGELCISVSNFFLHPDFSTIKPKYHVFTASHSPVSDEQYRMWFEDAGNKMPLGQNVFVALSDKYLIDKYKLFEKQNVYYYSTGQRDPSVGTIDISRRMPAIQSSPHIAIYIAFYLGVKKLALLGIDHDWILHYGKSVHFYDEKQSALTQANYNEWTKDFEFQLQSNLNLWRLYKGIRQYAHRNGVDIINATPESLLDVFPKKKLEEIIAI